MTAIPPTRIMQSKLDTSHSSLLMPEPSVSEGKPEILRFLESSLATTTSLGKPASDNTVASYSRSVKRLLSHSGKDWQALTPDDYVGYIQHRAQAVSHNSLVADDRNLRAVFALGCGKNAVSGKFCPFLVSALPKRLRSVNTNKLKLSEGQARELLAKAELSESYRDFMILQAMLMAGLRVSEIVEARREDYHHKSLHLVKTKGGKPRIVYIPSKLNDQLKDWLMVNKSEHLFADLQGRRANRRTVHQLVHRAGRRVGVRGLHPHALRRTYGSIAHARGAPLKFLQQQYGHSNITTTMGYIDIDAETSRRLANEFCEI